ncbi:MAG: pyruvate kinase [Chloroflexi bacterium]|nr:pyruvate kinase [Chloroflexota bacterium]
MRRSGALAKLAEIIAAADVVMVARGDLGVEIPIEEIPAVQKWIIRRCNLARKAGDYRHANAGIHDDQPAAYSRRSHRCGQRHLDGSDCVMLSGETAVGEYPIATVALMSRLAQQTEESMSAFDIVDQFKTKQQEGRLHLDDLLSLVVFETAEMLDPKVVFAPSRSGGTARRLCRFRLSQWIISPSQIESTCQELQFSYGIFPVYVPDPTVLTDPHFATAACGAMAA